MNEFLTSAWHFPLDSLRFPVLGIKSHFVIGARHWELRASLNSSSSMAFIDTWEI